jgi:D-tyrosyl-tRNA(Tyr) deacylase
VVQRVTQARVTVDGEQVATIAQGLLIYLGVAPGDTPEVARHLASRLAQLRIFPDQGGRMNRSVLDVGGEALVVSQFTLFADNRRGHRPSFSSAAPPELGEQLCRLIADQLRRLGVAQVQEGRFGSHMVVDSANDGPVTIVASSHEDPWQTNCG